MNKKFTGNTLIFIGNLYSFMVKWKKVILPITSVVILVIFLRWINIYSYEILFIFGKFKFSQILLIIFLILVSLILTVFTITLLTNDMGVLISFSDGYHSLNLSQLGSMIPGKIWSFIGLSGLLWAKGLSKIDSTVVVILNTIILLSASAFVGYFSIASTLGWFISFLTLLPIISIIGGYKIIENIRVQHIPQITYFPSRTAVIKTFILGIVIWVFISLSFSFFFIVSNNETSVPFWIVTSSYAAGYLGGFLSIIAPSGIGISEGIITIILRNYLEQSRILQIAISYRILHTSIIWINILITLIIKSLKKNK